MILDGLPLKELEDRSRLINNFLCGRDGIDPVNLLLLRYKDCKLRFQIEYGMDPVNPLLYRYKVRKLVRFPMEYGMDPIN